MIIAIIHFQNGGKQPEIFKSREDLNTWRASARVANIEMPESSRITKLEVSKPQHWSHHAFFVPRFHQYILSKN